MNKLLDILDDKMLDKLNDKEREFFNQVYPYLEENGWIANSKAAKLSGRPMGTTRRYLLKLVELGILIPTGENKNRKYLLQRKDL